MKNSLKKQTKKKEKKNRKENEILYIKMYLGYPYEVCLDVCC